MLRFDATARTRFLFNVLARARGTLNHSPVVPEDLRHSDRIVFGADRNEQVTEIFALRDPMQIVAAKDRNFLNRHVVCE